MKLYYSLAESAKIAKNKLNNLLATKRKLKHFHVTYIERNQAVSKIFTEYERITIFLVLEMRGSIILNVIELNESEYRKYMEHVAPWAVKK